MGDWGEVVGTKLMELFPNLSKLACAIGVASLPAGAPSLMLRGETLLAD